MHALGTQTSRSVTTHSRIRQQSARNGNPAAWPFASRPERNSRGAFPMKKKMSLPSAYAAATKDTRFEGTFEVLVPVPDRVKPHRAAQQFATLEAAESWIHSPEGKDAIERILMDAAK
jgi:hypothetical protein